MPCPVAAGLGFWPRSSIDATTGSSSNGFCRRPGRFTRTAAREGPQARAEPHRTGPLVLAPGCNITGGLPVMNNSVTSRQQRFAQLADAYGADLYRFAMWICGDDALAKDLVQETYIRAWRALDKLKEPGAAKTWLITILRREYARTFERKVPKFTDVDQIDVPERPGLEPDDRAEVQIIRRNILKLAPKYRDPLLLQVVMGYSCEEIARELRISKSAVMTQLFRAREQLMHRLQGDGVTGNIHELK